MTNPAAGPQYQTSPGNPGTLTRVRQDHEPCSAAGIVDTGTAVAVPVPDAGTAIPAYDNVKDGEFADGGQG